MNSESLAYVFLNAALVNNFVLMLFLGICPFLGISGKLRTALRMGIAVTFVMLISASAAYGIHALLVYLNARYLELIAYIAVIASTVQFVEMFIRRFSPVLFRTLGLFLPLITTNCAILYVALFQTAREYSYLQSVVFAFGAGLGFTLAIVIMAGMREQLDMADVPGMVKGTALTLLVGGMLSLAFMGFGGLGG
jgi:Na+-translocating ferredoxin:NAD+ oxidoreductase subunit A